MQILLSASFNLASPSKQDLTPCDGTMRAAAARFRNRSSITGRIAAIWSKSNDQGEVSAVKSVSKGVFCVSLMSISRCPMIKIISPRDSFVGFIEDLL